MTERRANKANTYSTVRKKVLKKLLHVFESSFTTMDAFLDGVLEPVLAAEASERGEAEQTGFNPEMRGGAAAGHITSIRHAGTFDIAGQVLKVFEIVLDDGVSIHRSRSSIRRAVRAFSDAYERALMVIHHEEPQGRPWLLSYVESRPTGSGVASVRQFTYLLGSGYSVRTAAERFARLDANKSVCIADIAEAFSVQSLTKEFYTKLQSWYEWAQSPEFHVTFPSGSGTDGEEFAGINEHLIRLIIRFLFIWFIRQKRLVSEGLFDADTLRVQLGDFDPEAGKDESDCTSQCEATTNYYRVILQNLFADVDKKTGECRTAFSGDGEGVRRAFVPNLLFFGEEAHQPGLITLLKQYHFTVEENTAEDIVIALDPELLGMVFENLLASYNPETRVSARAATGSFYTPRKVVRYMVGTTLSEHIRTEIAGNKAVKIAPEAIDRLIFEETCPEELKDQKDVIEEILFSTRVLDPACGSGAFLLGVMQGMLDILRKLDPFVDQRAYELKKRIIENCLYGIDIQPLAVQISKLRCIISLIMEIPPKEIQPSQGLPYFPNVKMHFIAANSLMPGTMGTDSEVSFQHHLHRRRDCEAHDSDKGGGREVLRDLKKNHSEEFDVRDGFDIVIGNPPYGSDMTESEKAAYKKSYKNLEKRFDIYMVFFEMGFQYCKDILCYITPDKWLSKTFALKFRENRMVPHMTRILHLRNQVFESVIVDAIITTFSKRVTSALDIVAPGDDYFQLTTTIDKRELVSPFLIDQYFTPHSKLIDLLETQPYRLEQFAKCEYASASPSDAYKLKDIICSNTEPSGDELIVINTGLIGKYNHHWNEKRMKYLKSVYDHPVVSTKRLEALLGKTIAVRVKSPKLIIKGLNLLNCTVDSEGRVMSTVATLYIRSSCIELLLILSAIINSPLMTAYCKKKYVSSSYCGGLEFTPAMIGQLPVPDLSNLDRKDLKTIIRKVREILICKDDVQYQKIISQIDEQIMLLYQISPDIL